MLFRLDKRTAQPGQPVLTLDAACHQRQRPAGAAWRLIGRTRRRDPGHCWRRWQRPTGARRGGHGVAPDQTGQIADQPTRSHPLHLAGGHPGWGQPHPRRPRRYGISGRYGRRGQHRDEGLSPAAPGSPGSAQSPAHSGLCPGPHRCLPDRDTDPQTYVKFLSGGNIQKTILAREIDACTDLLVAVYPSRGLDVGATEAVRRRLLEQREEGRAVLLISEDLDELRTVADRIAVLYEGRVMGILDADKADIETLGLMMAGAADHVPAGDPTQPHAEGAPTA